MTNMNYFVGDELANKVKHLSKALEIATNVIGTLEEENKRLAALLDVITDSNKQESTILVM